jgi:hypothetical protein
VHLANTAGKRPVTFDDVFVTLQATAAAIAHGTNTRVTFSQGATRVTIAPGASAWSDPIELSFVTRATGDRGKHAVRPMLLQLVLTEIGQIAGHSRSSFNAHASRIVSNLSAMTVYDSTRSGGISASMAGSDSWLPRGAICAEVPKVSSLVISSAFYSTLNVIEGSTCAARQAGTQQAIAETLVSRTLTQM